MKEDKVEFDWQVGPMIIQYLPLIIYHTEHMFLSPIEILYNKKIYLLTINLVTSD